MARRVIAVNEILEVIYQWHKGQNNSQIAYSLGINRKTVKRYLHMVREIGLSREKPLPDDHEILIRLREKGGLKRRENKAPVRERIAIFHEEIEKLLKQRVNFKQILRLIEERGIKVSYKSLKRYIHYHFEDIVSKKALTVHLEKKPGEEAQVDFGYAGMMFDPEKERMRKVWVFVMTLSYSRYPFVRFVHRMDIDTWIDCHIRAFEFFSAVPKKIVLDNLKAGVIKPDIYDPTLNPTYAELERYYGFIADPARAGCPKDKPRVERMIRTVKGQILSGRSFRDIEEANRYALSWSRYQYGLEPHGTTKRPPYEVFKKEEKPLLRPLPLEPFEIPIWRQCTVHPDCHIVFNGSYYSVPYRFTSKRVWIRAGRRLLRVYFENELIKVHPLAKRKGSWQTDQRDYPEKARAYLSFTPNKLRQAAKEVGENTFKLIDTILKEDTMRNLRKCQGILRLKQKYGTERLEAAAKRALFYENFNYRSIKGILEKGLDKEGNPTPFYPPSDCRGFLRKANYYVHTEG